MNKSELSTPQKMVRYFLLPYRKIFIILTLLTIFTCLAQELVPWYISKIVNLISNEQDKLGVYNDFLDLFIRLILLIGGVFVCNILFMVILQYKCLSPLSIFIREQLFNLLLDKDIFFWQKHSAGDIWGKIDLSRRSISAFSSIGQTFYCFGQILAIIISCFLLYRIYPSLMYVSIILAAFTLFLYNYISNNLKSSYAQFSKFKTLLLGKIVDLISNFFLLKTFGKERYEQGKLLHYLQIHSKAMKKHNWRYNKNQFVLKLLILLFQCSIIIYAVYLWTKHLILVGDIVYVMTAVGGFSSNLQGIGWFIPFFKQRNASLRTNIQTFNIPNQVKENAHARKLKIGQGKIEIKNLTFAYKDRPVLNNFSLTIKPKEKIGIIGISGGGKTTLLYLLQHLITPPKGTIFIDDQDISDISLESLHKAISFIPQDTTLFHRTILENIKYGSFTATNAHIQQAAKQACATDFILSSPLKYQTQVGDKGIKLSGGERQRIGIARAILKDSSILLLDEATSALDSKSEKFIQKAINTIVHNKTVIAVAHRLSTLKDMDRIVVIDKGKIVDIGKPSSILPKYSFMDDKL